jgi:hypothetical protein
MHHDMMKFGNVDSIAIALMVAADDYEPVGSRVTSSVFSDDADYDFLLLFEDDVPFNLDAKLCSEYVCESDSYEGARFKSYRKGSTNLIITEYKHFYDRFMLATKLATRFDVKTKNDRVRLFQAVLYGRDVDHG